MEPEIEPFLLLNDLALNCLSREEYANFLTIMKHIRDRSISVISQIKENQKEESTIRYSHDIEINLQYKIFKNNQIGERVELSQYSELPLLIKVPMDEDPETKIKTIYKKIIE